MTESRIRVPRDDRTWPRWATPFSAVILVAGLVTGVATMATAEGTTRAWVVVAFVATAALEIALYLPAMRRVLEGDPVPAWNNVTQLGLVVAWLFTAGMLGTHIAVATASGFFTGGFAANLWAMRKARGNRARVDEAEAELFRVREEVAREEPPPREYPADDVPAVGSVLRYVLADAVRNWFAWLVAGALTLTGCLVLGAPEAAYFGFVFVGVAALLYVTRRVLVAWLASRDFHRAETEPRRAYVVLLHDPTPQMVRPLLGIWSEEPVVTEGRFPAPEQVYRCDDDVDVLACYPGSVVVHEAWVDTGKRTMSKPRWVAANSGIALPHRRATLGQWTMTNHIRSARPEPAIPLTMPAPRARTETIVEVSPDVGSFAVKVAWRLAGLVAAALVFVWFT